MTGINITFGTDSTFDDDDITPILSRYGLEEHETTSEYQIWIYKDHDIVITRFKHKILIQGKEYGRNLDLLREILSIDGLNADSKNDEKIAKLFKTPHNTLFCMECTTPSLLIESEIQGLDISFKMECGHDNDMLPPMFMVTSRILPDINILINGSLSRLIDLGYFKGFEIVLSDFTIHEIDLLGPKLRTGASNEITRLTDLEKDAKIIIFNCTDGVKYPTKEEFDQKEDDKILEVANLTNSILLTGDRNLKDKAILKKRPTIYIHPKNAEQIKHIHETQIN